MNKSNAYIFIYSTVMVVVVATVLALAASVLKPFQLKNLEIAKKLEILHSVDKGWDASSAPSKNEYVEGEYSKYITQSFVINTAGDTIQGRDPFTIELKEEMRLDSLKRVFPIFICTQDNGEKNYIFPVRGKGLWGPVWGYVALKDDMNTIAGVFFDHEQETPGLGAEISTRPFQKQFIGQTIFDDQGKFVSIAIQKSSEPKIPGHSVDAISGGTLTSKGLQATIHDSLINYLAFLNKNKK
jgi:Na+-transporting NADH:ubiquinone oxidoreductase subunit C